MSEDELRQRFVSGNAAGNMAKRMDVAAAGMRYRLRSLKVCQRCLKVYKVIHQAAWSHVGGQCKRQRGDHDDSAAATR